MRLYSKWRQAPGAQSTCWNDAGQIRSRGHEKAEMDCDSTAAETVVSLRLRNERAVAATLHLEPWGEEYTMPPGATFQVVGRGPKGDSLELEIGDEHLVVYGWSGSVVEVHHDGVELGETRSAHSPVPATPPGTSVATFLRRLFR